MRSDVSLTDCAGHTSPTGVYDQGDKSNPDLYRKPGIPNHIRPLLYLPSFFETHSAPSCNQTDYHQMKNVHSYPICIGQFLLWEVGVVESKMNFLIEEVRGTNSSEFEWCNNRLT